MALVRMFGYSGIVQIEQRLLKFHNADSVFVRQEPYLWKQMLTTNGATPVPSVVQSPDDAVMCVIEVEVGQAIRYEINLNGPSASNSRVASAQSPKLQGENIFQWARGATISIVDVAATG